MSRLSSLFLGFFSIIILISSFFNIIYSYYFDLYLNLKSYFLTFLISFILCLVLAFNWKKNLNDTIKKVLIFEKISIVVLGYLLFPIILSIPFLLNNFDFNLIDSYFESISGFTSTGFSMFENLKHIDQSLILWRSTIQWIGGLYFLFSIILLLDIFDNNLKKSFTQFSSIDSKEFFKQVSKILILYIFFTILIFCILKLVDIRTFNSFNLSLTIISSGGFLPTNLLESMINDNLKILALSICLLFSFFSIFFLYNLINYKKKKFNFFIEDVYLLFYLIILLVIFFIFFNIDNNFLELFLSVVSCISNVGFYFNNSQNNLMFIYFILVIIGGSFLSTSSGLRFIKIFYLIKFSFNNLSSHLKPSQILANKSVLNISAIKNDEINKYFLSIIVFILSLFSISILLTLTQMNFVESFKLGILTLMNTTNSSLFDLQNFEFKSLLNSSKIILIIFMIIGRVELLTILILLKKYLFKN